MAKAKKKKAASKKAAKKKTTKKKDVLKQDAIKPKEEKVETKVEEPTPTPAEEAPKTVRPVFDNEGKASTTKMADEMDYCLERLWKGHERKSLLRMRELIKDLRDKKFK